VRRKVTGGGGAGQWWWSSVVVAWQGGGWGSYSLSRADPVTLPLPATHLGSLARNLACSFVLGFHMAQHFVSPWGFL
jgi:hypothetical protein